MAFKTLIKSLLIRNSKTYKNHTEGDRVAILLLNSLLFFAQLYFKQVK